MRVNAGNNQVARIKSVVILQHDNGTLSVRTETVMDNCYGGSIAAFQDWDGVLDEITRLIRPTCPSGERVCEAPEEVEGPDATLKDADLSISEEVGASSVMADQDWLRVRAMELAISAGRSPSVAGLVSDAKEIEVFLKGGAK